MFDLLAADESGYTIPIQVKAINGPSWQYKADSFIEIEILDDFQHVRGKKQLLNPALVCVYISLGAQEQQDEFFFFSLKDLQEHTFAIYKSRKRLKNPASIHCAVWPKNLVNICDLRINGCVLYRRIAGISGRGDHMRKLIMGRCA